MSVTEGPALPLVLRPRRGRIVPYVLALVALLGFCAVAVALTSEGRGGAKAIDRGLLVMSGAMVVLVLHRLASVRVEADESGVLVVNLFRRRRLEWAEILGVRLSPGDPWLGLDLTDGTSVSAMGVQGADGAWGLAQARLLAAAVAAHGMTPPET